MAFLFYWRLAVLRWGEIRMTQDIDLCLLCGYGNEEVYIRTLLDVFESRIENTFDFAKTNRVLLLYASNGVSIDITFSGLPFENEMIKRATPFNFNNNCKLLICSAEDLIILKVFAGRAKDWMDVEGIVMRQGENLNSDYIIEHLSRFQDVKDMQDSLTKFNKLLEDAK